MAERRVVARIPSVKVTVGGETHTGWLPRHAAEPRPLPVREVEVRIEITDLGGGFELLYEATDGSGWSDTWHPTLEEAMEVAEEDFGVHRREWQTA
jgi:hypothetical protein